MSYNFYHNLPEIARNGGFKLCEGEDEKDSSQIDWRFIATADIHKIIKESDFEKIDECVPFLITSSIGDLFSSKALDPVIGKIYSLSQLSLEYLLFCTQFLDKSVSSLRESLYNYQKQTVELQAAVEDRDSEIVQLKRCLQRARDEIYPCIKCAKNFENQSLLEAHIHEAHQQQLKEKDANLIKAIKLELEVKQLKEKLNLTERELMQANAMALNASCEKCQRDMMKTFSSVGIQINSEEKERDEREKEHEAFETEKLSKFNDSIRSFMSEQVDQFKQQKADDERRHQEEVAQLKEMLDKTLKSLQETEKKQAAALAAPSPAPRTSIVSEKKMSLESENLWKIRFQELEKMYEANQSQMAQSMKDMEQAYSEKMNKLEMSMRLLKSEKRVQSPPRSKPKEVVVSQLCEPVVKESLMTERNEDKAKAISPEQHDASTIVKASELEIKPSTFGGQKNGERESNKKTLLVQRGTNKVPVNRSDSKKSAIALLNQRMREINVPKHSRQLSQKEVERIYSELASRRESIKKHCKDFYISRKNIKAKVERIYLQHHVLSDKMSAPQAVTQEKPKEKAFQDQLERMLQKKIDDQHKPKKKVLFNLEKKSSEDLKIQNEDDSDFNITSFEEDLK